MTIDNPGPNTTPKITSLKVMLCLLGESIESVERGNPKVDKLDADLRAVAIMCGDLRVELAGGTK